MPYYCTVPHCTSMAGKAKNVSFHQFPRDEELAKLWNRILKRGKPYTKYSKVCSLHFRPEDYTITSVGKNKGQWRTLRKDAIPSQNLPPESPGPGPIHRSRSTGAWTPNSLPPAVIDPRMQQQMAQAIYLQTMLAMQAVNNGSHQLPTQSDAKFPINLSTAHSSNLKLSEIEQILLKHKETTDELNIDTEKRNQEQNLRDNIVQDSQNDRKESTSYKCQECTKCFKDPDVFVLHKRTHMNRNNIQERLPVSGGSEKENFNSNSDFSGQNTLKANPILANLLKSGISTSTPVPNGILDTNNILSLENQVMSALNANMESYIRNLSTMLSNNKDTTNGQHSEDSYQNLVQNGHGSENEQDYSDTDGSRTEQDDDNSIQDSPDFKTDHSDLQDVENSEINNAHNSTQDQDNSLESDHNSVDSQNSTNSTNDQNIDMTSIQEGHNSSQSDEKIMQMQYAIQESTNFLQCDRNFEQETQNSLQDQSTEQEAQNYLQCDINNEEVQNSLQTDQNPVQGDNSSESQGSHIEEDPSCDKEDLNDSKDSNNLVIDENL